MASSGGQCYESALRARYSMSYMGMRVGQLAVATTVGPSVYKTQLETRLTGLATFAAPYDTMHMKASGLLRGGNVMPCSFVASQAGGSDSRSLRLALKAGSATTIEMKPPVDDLDIRIPLTDDHKRNVIDPASAFVMIIPPGEQDGAPAACMRTFPLFGGFFRADLALRYVKTEDVRSAGYSGRVAVCGVQYVPMAGHKPDGATTKFIPENHGIELRLATVPGAPVIILVVTAARLNKAN